MIQEKQKFELRQSLFYINIRHKAKLHFFFELHVGQKIMKWHDVLYSYEIWALCGFHTSCFVSAGVLTHIDLVNIEYSNYTYNALANTLIKIHKLYFDTRFQCQCKQI